jgi:tape measure domain-containing protein
MTTTLGQLILELGLDDSKYRAKMSKLERDIKQKGSSFEKHFGFLGEDLAAAINNSKLRPEVDDSELTALNAHFDLKAKHYASLQKQFDENPLTPKVDMSKIEAAMQEQLELQANIAFSSTGDGSFGSLEGSISSLQGSISTLTQEIKTNAAGTQAASKSIHDTGVKLSRVVHSKDGNIIEKILGIPGRLVDTISTGFFEGLGTSASMRMGQGVSDYIEGKSGTTFYSMGKGSARFVYGKTQQVGQIAAKAVGYEDGLKGVKRDAAGMVRRVGNYVDPKNLAKAIAASEDIARRMRSAGYRVGDGIVAALEDEGDAKSKVNAFIRGVNLSDFKEAKAEAEEELKAYFEELSKIYLVDEPFNIVTAPLDSFIRSRRTRSVKERAVPLAVQRAEEIATSKKKKNTGNVVGEDTEELFIFSGGYAKARGLSGARLSRDFNKTKRDNQESIWIKNADTDIDKERSSTAYGKMFELFKSLAKPNIRGYSKDAVEMAAQAIAAKEKNPSITIKIIGESGGGFVAEEAAQILKELGIGGVESISVGTPDFIGGLSRNSKNKIISPDEFLGAETHKLYAKLGLANISTPEQNILGVTEHPFEHYQEARVAQVANIMDGAPEPIDKKAAEQIRAAADTYLQQDRSGFGRDELTQIAKSAFINLQIVRRHLHYASEDLFDDLKYAEKAFEQLFVETAPEDSAMTEVRRVVKKAKEILSELKLAPGLASGATADQMIKELKVYQKEFRRLYSASVGTKGRKFKDIDSQLSETITGLKTTNVRIKPEAVALPDAPATERSSTKRKSPKVRQIEREAEQKKKEWAAIAKIFGEEVAAILKDNNLLKPEEEPIVLDFLEKKPSPVPADNLNLAAKGLRQAAELLQVGGKGLIAAGKGIGAGVGGQAEKAITGRINQLLARVPGDPKAIEAAPDVIDTLSNLNLEQIQKLAELGTEDAIQILKALGQITLKTAKGGGAIAGGVFGATKRLADGNAAKMLQKGNTGQEAIQGGFGDTPRLPQSLAINGLKDKISAVRAYLESQKDKALLDPQAAQKQMDLVFRAVGQLISEVDRNIKALPSANRTETREGSQLANLKSQIVRLGQKAAQIEKTVDALVANQPAPEKLIIEQLPDDEPVNSPLRMGGVKAPLLLSPQKVERPERGTYLHQVKRLGESFTQYGSMARRLAGTDEGQEAVKHILLLAHDAREAISELVNNSEDSSLEFKKIVSAARQKITKAESTARKSGTEETLQEIGQFTGQGMSGGISQSISAVRKSAKDLAEAAINQVEDTLEIQSPSRVFKRIGAFVAKGFAEGIRSGAAMVSKSFDFIGGQAAKARDKSFGFLFEGVTNTIDKALSNLKSSAEGFPVFGKPLGELADGLIKNRNLIVSLATSFLGFDMILRPVLGWLFQMAGAFAEVAMEMQSLETMIRFTSGSKIRGLESSNFAKDKAVDFGANIMGSMRGFAGLSASAQGTGLEGEGVKQLYSSVAQAGAVYGIDAQSQERAYIALEQVISKGVVSAEELRGQLSEAIPGAMQVAARALGVTSQELDRMISSGELMAEDFLPKFAQQLEAETFAGLALSAETARTKTGKLMNEVFLLQEALGKAVIPVRNVGMDVLSTALAGIRENAELLAKVIGFVLVAAFSGSILQAVNLVTSLAKIPAVLQLIKLAGTKMLPILGKTLQSFALYIAVIDTFTILHKGMKDASGGLKDLADAAESSWAQYKEAIEGATAAQGEFNKAQKEGLGGKLQSLTSGESLLESTFVGSIVGKDASRIFERGIQENFGKILALTTPGAISSLASGGKTDNIRLRTYEDKKADDMDLAIGRLLDTGNQTISEVLSSVGLDGKPIGNLGQIDQVDKQIRALQMKRSGLNPSDGGQIRQVQAEIDKLIASRKELAQPFSILQANIAQQIESYDSVLKALSDEMGREGLSEERMSQLKSQYNLVENQLNAARDAQERLNSAINEGVDNVQSLAREFSRVRGEFAANQYSLKLDNAQQQRRLAEIQLTQRLTPGVRDSAELQIQQTDIAGQLQNNAIASQRMRSILAAEEYQTAITSAGFTLGSVRSAELEAYLPQLNQDSGLYRVLSQATEQLKALEELDLETAGLETQLLQSQVGAQESMWQLAADVKQFFTDISNQAKELSLATDESKNQSSLMEAQATLKGALIGFSKSFLNGFVESLIGLIDALNEPLKNAIAAQQSILSASTQYQQLMTQSTSLSNQFMTGGVPGLMMPGGGNQALTGNSGMGAGTLVGIGGNTGRSTGPHLDVRYPTAYAQSAGYMENGRRMRPLDEHLSRLAIDGVPLTQTRITSEHSSRNPGRSGHDGVDFATRVGGRITSTVGIQSVSEPRFDNNGGGWVTTVTFADGVQLNLLHQDPSVQGAALGTGGQSGGGQGATNAGGRGVNAGFSAPPQVGGGMAASGAGAGRIPRGGTVRRAERVTQDPAGAQAMINAANQLQLDPREFAALMSWESAGSFNPNIVGGDNNEYKGLIQFSPDNQRTYGTGGQQSIAQQMPAITEYLIDRGFRPGEHDIRHAYSAVLAGNASERYWDRRDSNGTSVRNAASRFQQGDHYENAMSFLNNSLGSNWSAASSGAGLNRVNSTQINSSQFNQSSQQANAQLSEALALGEQNYQQQLANINQQLEAQNLLSQINAELSQQGALDQLTQAERDIREQQRNFSRTIEDLRLEAMPDTPEADFLQQMTDLDRRQVDMTGNLGEYVERLDQTVQQSDRMIEILGTMADSGLIPEETANTFIEALRNAQGSIGPSFEEAKAYVDQVDGLFNDLRTVAMENFERAQYERLRAAESAEFDLRSQIGEAEIERYSREARDPVAGLDIRMGLDLSQQEMALQDGLHQISEQLRTGLIDEEQADRQRELINQLNDLTVERIERERALNEQLLREAEQRALFDSGQALGQAQVQQGELNNFGLGGGMLGDQMQEQMAIDSEQQRFMEQMTELERRTDLSAEAMRQLQAEAQALNEVNLQNINSQFDEMRPVYETAAQGLETFFTDVITGSKSAGEAFADFARSMLAQVAKMLVNRLLTGLLGNLFGGGGIFGFSEGGVVSNSIQSFRRGGSVIAIPGFMNGSGMVNYVSGQSVLRQGDGAIAQALQKEAPAGRSVLATLTVGERVLSVEQNRRFEELGLASMIQGYSDGGRVGGGGTVGAVNQLSQSTSVTIPITIQSNDTQSNDARDLGDKIRGPVQDLVYSIINKEKKRGGSLSQ